MKINGLKLIAFVVVLTITLSFCGCKKTNISNETSSETDSTASEGAVSTVVTQTPTPDNSTSSTVSQKEPSTSTPQYPTSSGAATSTPSTTTPTTSTPSTTTPSVPSNETPTIFNGLWSCPDPSAHPLLSYCEDEAHHKVLIEDYQRIQNSTNKAGYCGTCGLPLSPTIGVPGTCFGELIDGKFTCNPTYE